MGSLLRSTAAADCLGLAACALVLAGAPVPARAGVGRDLEQAAVSLDVALEGSRGAEERCRRFLVAPLQRAADRLEQGRRNPQGAALADQEAELLRLSLEAPRHGCPQLLVERLEAALHALTAARTALGEGQWHDRGDEDRDGRGHAGSVTIGPLHATLLRGPGEPLLRLTAQLTFTGMAEQPFSLAARSRPEGGDWSRWSRSPQTVPAQDPWVLREAELLLPLSQLGGARRSTLELGVLDAHGRTLASQAAPWEGAERDCGTGEGDPGCPLSRDGQPPLDKQSLQGLLDALGRTTGDLGRRDLCARLLEKSRLTSRQLGRILERFTSETVVLEVARAAAPRVVDPENAPPLAARFRSSLIQRDFVQLFVGQLQRGDGPAPGGAPPASDCGAGGEDPDCLALRDGRPPLGRRTFTGVLEALRAEPQELTRKGEALKLLASAVLTARQLGLLLDLFHNDLLRLDLARALAPRLVEPQHALGLADRFSSPLLQRDFQGLIAGQQP